MLEIAEDVAVLAAVQPDDGARETDVPVIVARLLPLAKEAACLSSFLAGKEQKGKEVKR